MAYPAELKHEHKCKSCSHLVYADLDPIHRRYLIIHREFQHLNAKGKMSATWSVGSNTWTRPPFGDQKNPKAWTEAMHELYQSDRDEKDAWFSLHWRPWWGADPTPKHGMVLVPSKIDS